MHEGGREDQLEIQRKARLVESLPDTHRHVGVGAAVTALGAIGSARFEELLSKLAEGKTPQAEAAAKALKALRAGLAESQKQGT
jgi:hypothetical protein